MVDYEIVIEGREPVLNGYFAHSCTIPADEYPEAFSNVYNHLLLRLGIDSDCIRSIKIHSVPNTTTSFYGG